MHIEKYRIRLYMMMGEREREREMDELSINQ